MQPLSTDQRNHIISLLEVGHSAYQISSATGINTGTIFSLHRKHHPYLPKSSGGHLTKLSSSNIHHGLCFIDIRKVENAVQVTKALQDITNEPLSAQTTCQHLKNAGMKAVVKRKRPLLSKYYGKARLDFAISHQHWTVEDWKNVVWYMRPKSIVWGQMGRGGGGKGMERAWLIGW